MGFPPFIPTDDPITGPKRKFGHPRNSLLDSFDAGYFRDMLADVPLDALPERHRGRWTSDTRTVKPDADQAIRGDVDQLNISPIGLD